MSRLIVNATRATCYFDVGSGELLDRADALSPKRIYDADLDAHIRNAVPPVVRPDTYRPVAGLVPIPARTRWNFDGARFRFHSDVECVRQQHTASLDRIHAVAARYLAVLGSEPIAIEMSGGLDTAIVIDVLRSLGANLVLVGFMSERYEFRTERAIQEQYLRDADPVIALSDDDGPPFADLTQTPLHPIPVAASLFHKMHSAVATAAASKGARRVLNGVGGDALLCDGFDGAIAGVIPDDHRGWGIFDPWPNDSVYMPRGMSYVPSFALWPIPELVWSMRRGQGEDVRKVWARRLFDGRLSRELTKYAYKADHNAWFHDGLRRAESDIRRIARTAYELTKRTELHPETMSRDVLRSTTLDDVAQCALLSRLCFASWVHGFAREGLM